MRGASMRVGGWGVAGMSLAGAMLAALVGCAGQSAPSGANGAGADVAPSIKQEIPGAAYSFELRLVPGNADGTIKPFYMGVTEVTWEAADAYVYKLDEERGRALPSGADAVTRPTKPYLPPDRGFGHEGYAAITMSFKNAQEFCVWLSAHSGKKYRLATEAEWEWACTAGGKEMEVPSDALDGIAWYEANSNETPHPVATKKANGLGLHDMLGNVQEWCVGVDEKGAVVGVTKGGSYRDGAERMNAKHRQVNDRAWNASDPQVPKSKWWLADGPFVGFRVVREVE